ncbi:MAG: nuclear transport factor 2 family protein [Rhodospirillales bacterium]
MSAEAKLTFANEAFYAAFAGGDLEAMTALWSAQDPLYCLHPSWPLLTGRKAIVESWSNILAAGASSMACEAPIAWRQGEVGLVLCRERLGDALLAATNLFRLEGGDWRLFHHHAGQTRVLSEPEGAAQRLQ